MEVDARRAGRVVVGICAVALAVLVVVLFVAGADKNAQITRLRQHGVAVEVRVSSCVGLLGGSGSNAAGYACRGTYTVDGHRYREAIPGDTLHTAGTSIRGVTVRSDPELLSTPALLEHENPSWRVFILPGILLAVLALFAGALALKRRHVRNSPAPGPSPTDKTAAA